MDKRKVQNKNSVHNLIIFLLTLVVFYLNEVWRKYYNIERKKNPIFAVVSTILILLFYGCFKSNSTAKITRKHTLFPYA